MTKMQNFAFSTPCLLSRSSLVLPCESTSSRPLRVGNAHVHARAAIKLEPGIPSGQDALDNVPLRYYKPRPVETYEKRSFSTILPRNWEGEDTSIGVSDVGPMTKQAIEERRIIKVDSASTSAFLEYGRMVKDERARSLEMLKERSSLGKTGRATCGEEEGKAFVSNYQTILVEGVKAVEYWGTPNGSVPKLFGGKEA